jgi:hypothetical protein
MPGFLVEVRVLGDQACECAALSEALAVAINPLAERAAIIALERFDIHLLAIAARVARLALPLAVRAWLAQGAYTRLCRSFSNAS